MVVWDGGPPLGVGLPYTVMWSLFGVHAGFRLMAQLDRFPSALAGVKEAYLDVDWVEAMYACLSWTAKLYVFWTSFAYAYDGSVERPGRRTFEFDRTAGANGLLLYIAPIGCGVVIDALLTVASAKTGMPGLSTHLVMRLLPA